MKKSIDIKFGNQLDDVGEVANFESKSPRSDD